MKKKLHELEAQRSTLLTELDTLIKTGPENWTEQQSARRDAIAAELDTIDGDIKRWQQIEADKKRIAEQEAVKVDVPAVHTQKHRFSISRAIGLVCEGRQLDGIEKDTHDEGVEEMKNFGIVQAGGGSIVVPSRVYIQHRDIAVGSGSSGISNTIETQLGSMIEALRPRTKAIVMGADTSLSGLRSYLDLPRQTGLASAVWDGEVTAATKTKPTLDKIQIRPVRLSNFSEFSRLSSNMSSLAMDNFITNELLDGQARKLDETVFNGSGVGNIPLGILNDPNVNVHALGADGDFLELEDLSTLESLISGQNADVAKMGFLTTPGVRGYLRTKRIDAGSGLMIWPWGATELGGYKADVTTLMPSNLTKGVGTNLHAMIFGNWAQQIIASFAGTEIIVNPYGNVQGSSDGLDVTGQVRVTTHSWWDIKRRQPKGFAVISDIKVA